MRLLDTNVCIAFLNGSDAGLKRRLDLHADAISVCSVVKAELQFGARSSARVAENLAKLDEFFALLPSYAFDDEAAAEYGIIRAQLRRAGTPVGPNDLMIGAIALAHDAVVVTRNTAEFVRIPGLKVERW